MTLLEDKNIKKCREIKIDCSVFFFLNLTKSVNLLYLIYLKVGIFMDNLYQEAKQITTSIIKIYILLSKLAKEEKTNTQDYQDLCLVLKSAKEIEKNKYKILCPYQKYLDENYYIMKDNNSKKDGYFLPRTEEILTAIRILNQLDKQKKYMLDGNKVNISFSIQNYVDDAFFFEITQYLKGASLEEREALIDFQYSFLAISVNLNEEDLFIPKKNTSMSEQEFELSLMHLMPKIQELEEQLLKYSDKDVNAETLLSVLYTKACISLLPPLYEGIVLQEWQNTLNLYNISNYFKGVTSMKMYKLLCLICEDKALDKWERRH